MSNTTFNDLPSVDHLVADSVSVSLIPIVGARDDVVDIVNLKCLTKQKSPACSLKLAVGLFVEWRPTS